MEISCHRRSKQDDTLKIRSGCGSQPADELADLFLRNHMRPRWLPAAAGSAATRTSAAESAKPAASASTAKTSSTPAAPSAPISTTSAKHSRKKYPEQDAAKRSKKNDQHHDN